MIYVAYYLLFVFVYDGYFSPVYKYSGFADAHNPINFAVGLISCAALPLLIGRDKSPSFYFLHFLMAAVFVPSMVLYSELGLAPEYYLLTAVSTLVAILIPALLTLKTIRLPKISDNKIIYLLIFISIVNVLGTIAFGGLEFFNLDISKVYTIRREAASAVPAVFGYTNSNIAKVAIPFGIAFSLHNRKFLFAVVFVLISILSFALTAQKSPLFFSIVTIFVYCAWSDSLHKRTVCAAIILLLASWLDLWLKTNDDEHITWVAGIAMERGLLLPAYLNHLYIEYFSNLPKYFWSTSKLSLGLADPIYNLEPANLIGLQYFGNEDTSANTGFIGSGFANAGAFGSVLYSVILGFYLSLLDAYRKVISPRVIVTGFISVVLSFMTSADFSDMLLTHGLLFTLGILVISRSSPSPMREFRDNADFTHRSQAAKIF